VTAPPVVVNDPAKKQTPPATQEPPKPAPVGDDEIAKDARQQAERIRKELESGGNGNSGFEGGKSQNGGTPVVAGGGQQTVENRTGLSPAGGGTPNLTVQPPAPEGDDMAELHSMKEGVKGHKTLYATIGGGLLGGILGGLIGMIFGPVGMIIGAIAGAAAGAYGGHALGKKLWG